VGIYACQGKREVFKYRKRWNYWDLWTPSGFNVFSVTYHSTPSWAKVSIKKEALGYLRVTSYISIVTSYAPSIRSNSFSTLTPPVPSPFSSPLFHQWEEQLAQNNIYFFFCYQLVIRQSFWHLWGAYQGCDFCWWVATTNLLDWIYKILVVAVLLAYFLRSARFLSEYRHEDTISLADNFFSENLEVYAAFQDGILSVAVHGFHWRRSPFFLCALDSLTILHLALVVVSCLKFVPRVGHFSDSVLIVWSAARNIVEVWGGWAILGELNELSGSFLVHRISQYTTDHENPTRCP